ncbi:tetratricopeptide repeat protein [Flavobacterium sp. TSSA_36]|uniref:tetratricopeptide repeat protein n=1 Tax=Flavobacterium sp. TSSA_36 TaxID=3447669 RepID=UPI003F2CB67B
MRNIFLSLLLQITVSTYAQTNLIEIKKKQDAIIEEFLNNCAKNCNYNYQMSEWQNCLDEGLKKDSTIAYLWQQKAMPYFKARKYEVGMQYIDKAVQYDPKEWQPYRAFIKCIFAKTYKEAIIDFEDCIKKYGNGYRMDHTYSFYIGLSYLQLNEYNKAEILFKEYIDDIYKNRQGLEHPTAYFYYGISQYEQKKYNEAIITFDKALKTYPNFSDVKYYKAICLARINKKEDVSRLVDESKEDSKKGFSINEDNTIYEMYPYQKKWHE